MKMNMNAWIDSIISNKERQIMPVMTYPGLQIIGKSVLDMVTQGEVQYESVTALWERFPMTAATNLIMDLSVESEAFGCRIKFSKDEIPSVSERLIESFEQLDTLKVPAVGTGRTACHLEAAKLVTKRITKHPVFGGIIGPFSLAGRLSDLTGMLTEILIDPDRSHKLLDKCTSFLKEYALAFKNAGCNGILVAEPAAGLLAAEQCEQFSSDYIRQIVNYVQDERFMAILHNCGNTVGLVESMAGTHAKGFHFGNAVNMLEILPQVPPDRLVFGNIDPVNIIKHGSKEVIKAATGKLLSQTAQYRNFVLSSGCDIPPNTPLDHIGYIFEALEEFNRQNKV